MNKDHKMLTSIVYENLVLISGFLVVFGFIFYLIGYFVPMVEKIFYPLGGTFVSTGLVTIIFRLLLQHTIVLKVREEFDPEFNLLRRCSQNFELNKAFASDIDLFVPNRKDDGGLLYDAIRRDVEKSPFVYLYGATLREFFDEERERYFTTMEPFFSNEKGIVSFQPPTPTI